MVWELIGASCPPKSLLQESVQWMWLLGNLYMELAKAWQQEVSSNSIREPEESQLDWDSLHFKKLEFILHQISFHFAHVCRKTVTPTLTFPT